MSSMRKMALMHSGAGINIPRSRSPSGTGPESRSFYERDHSSTQLVRRIDENNGTRSYEMSNPRGSRGSRPTSSHRSGDSDHNVSDGIRNVSQTPMAEFNRSRPEIKLPPGVRVDTEGNPLAPVEDISMPSSLEPLFHGAEGKQNSQVGAYDTTWLNKEWRDRVAIKFFRCKEKNQRKEAGEAIRWLKELNHIHVVAFLASFMWVKNECCLIMYPSAQYDLEKYFRIIRSADGSEDVQQKLRHLLGFFNCLTSALLYLHQRRIKHRDIKPQNILIDKFNNVLLTDFGISKQYQHDEVVATNNDFRCTINYAAPEQLDIQLAHDLTIDIFSLGCVFLEMATVLAKLDIRELRGHFSRPEPTEVRGVTRQKTLYARRLDGVSPWFARLRSMQDGLERSQLNVIESMLSEQPESRPLIDDIRCSFRSTNTGCECLSNNNQPVDPVILLEAATTSQSPFSSSIDVDEQPLKTDNTESNDDGNSKKVRIYDPTKALTTIVSVEAIKGKGVFIYDGETTWSKVRQFDCYQKGVFVPLPWFPRRRNRAVKGDINLWKKISIPALWSRMMGTTKYVFVRGNFPDSAFE